MYALLHPDNMVQRVTIQVGQHTYVKHLIQVQHGHRPHSSQAVLSFALPGILNPRPSSTHPHNSPLLSKHTFVIAVVRGCHSWEGITVQVQELL